MARPAEPRSVEPRAEPRPTDDRFTGETSRDRVFANFLRDKSGGMVREASVALEQRGKARIKLDRSVTPDETLPLTNSLMTGARRDYADQPIDLALYDPTGDLILHARYRVGQGVKYQLAGETKEQPAANSAGRDSAPRDAAPAPASAESNRSGATAADREFAEWAEDHGRAYLRYIEADLERHGRLWFGVTREVKPADVPKLTQSLLEGAHKKFPRGDLMATVFDPEGGKIGRATLSRDGSIRWNQ